MATVIVLGASARAAAYSAIRGKYEPYAIDGFADQDLAAVCPAIKIGCYPQDFEAALAAAPDARWIYTGGLENHSRLVDRLAAIRPLAGNRGAVLRRIRDPRQLGIAADSAGCPMPGAKIGAQLLVKPRRSGGGLGIRIATPEDLPHTPRGCYLQELVEGEAASAVFVAARGRAALLGATWQLLGRDFEQARSFLYVGSIGPLPLDQIETALLHRLGNELASRFSLQGLFNVDFVRDRGRVWPLEVNPRYSASVEVLERALNVTSIPLHLDACAGGNLPVIPNGSGGACCGKAIIYAERDGIVPDELTPLIAAWNQPGKLPLVADLPRVGDTVLQDQPILTVFADEASMALVESTLRRRVASIKQVLKF